MIECLLAQCTTSDPTGKIPFSRLYAALKQLPHAESVTHLQLLNELIRLKIKMEQDRRKKNTYRILGLALR